MKVLIILLALVSLSFAQAGIFGTAAAPRDTVTLIDSTATSSHLILFNAYPEGVATLFIAGGDTAYQPTGVVGEYRIYFGKNTGQDVLYGPWTAFSDSVLFYADLDNGDYSSGEMVGEVVDLGALWVLGLGVEFRFTQYGGDGSSILLLGYLLFY